MINLLNQKIIQIYSFFDIFTVSLRAFNEFQSSHVYSGFWSVNDQIILHTSKQ